MYHTNPLFWPFLLVIDVLGYLVFFWLKFVPLRPPRRIVLVKLEHIGDVLLTTPAFRALRKRFPRARIDVLVRDFTAPVLAHNKNVDNILVWNAPWLSRLGKRTSWLSVPRMIRALRRNRYDLAIDFHGDPRNIVLASMVAPYRVGFGARGFGFLLNKVVPYGQGHAIERSLALAAALGAESVDRAMELHVSRHDEHIAATLVRPLGKHKLVCIAPGSGRKEKNWLHERWAAVADALIEQHGVRVVITGSTRDAVLAENILRGMRHKEKVLNLCGKTSLAQLAAVIKRCALVLAPDSGTIHVARAMRTPLIGLYTVESARAWGYHESRFQSIQKRRAQDIGMDAVLAKIREMREHITFTA